jgi:hypothetical protein
LGTKLNCNTAANYDHYFGDFNNVLWAEFFAKSMIMIILLEMNAIAEF